ncbi:MAG: amino acid ABC transporter permease [Deltaproteobacteria bacterium]|jgi:polar amino acid transport system permease protein|nr:amino acid ABC transporter permease [Deltaproteobacteria bacterium]
MGTWEFYTEVLIPVLNRGLLLSIKIIIPSAILAVLLGILTGAGRAAGPSWLKKPLDLYVAIFRGTPLVVQLTMWYFGLTSATRWLQPLFEPMGLPAWTWMMFTMRPFTAAIFSFALCGAAYHSEYIRGALLSVKKGQFLAAQSLGFTKLQTFLYITAPVALRRAVPGCGNELIYLIKYSSLAILVTLKELTGSSKHIASLYFRHLECYFLTALYYLAMVTIATWLLNRLERFLTLPGLGRYDA